MPAEDSTATRMVRSELTRRYIDSSALDVRVMHGVVYLRGEIAHLRSHPEIDLIHEEEVLKHILINKPGIREVIWEAKIKKKMT